MWRRVPIAPFLIFLASSLVAISAVAAPEKPVSGYNQPSKEILEELRAPSPPAPYVSPTHDKILLVSWEEYPALARVATPYLKLADARVEPKNHSKHDTPGGYGINPCAVGFELVQVVDGKRTPVALPAGSCLEAPQWSADGKRFAFANVTADAVELWLADATDGKAHKVPGVRLNPMVKSPTTKRPAL